MIEIREALPSDIPDIREIFRASYGSGYRFPDFYDETYLTKLIWTDDTLILVAEDTETGKVLGTASIVLEIGAYTDLVAELGRLAVHPDARGRGIGTMLMADRVERVRGRVHVGVVDGRVVHPFTQRIAQKHGFSPVGFYPMKSDFGEGRECLAVFVQYFGPALELRRNHPRVVPEMYQIAGAAMENVGIPLDVIVDDRAAPYPHGGDYSMQELTTDGYSALLRIERGRVAMREVFGPMRLHYGLFRLTQAQSNYLIARDSTHIVGAIGFMHDTFGKNVRVFELIHLEDQAVRAMLEELLRYCEQELGVVTVEVDVRADAARMQRTLLELGFLPVAYIPALAFRRVERLDVVKMARLLVPLETGSLALIPPTQQVAELVLRGFGRREVLPRIREAMDQIELFTGLAPEQARRVARACGYARFETGTEIFAAGDESAEMYVLLEGEVRIEVPGRQAPIGTVRAGECLGEVALLKEAPHSATATAKTHVEAGVLSDADLKDLVRQRPDIGVVLYRNLASDVGGKLRRSGLPAEE